MLTASCVWASGVGVNTECINVINPSSWAKKNKYIMSKDFIEIIVDKSSNSTSFIAALPETECRCVRF